MVGHEGKAGMGVARCGPNPQAPDMKQEPADSSCKNFADQVELVARVQSRRALSELVGRRAIAAAVLLLGAAASSMCTGQTLTIDRGWT